METQNSNNENVKDPPLYTLIKNLVNISNTDSSTTVENSQLMDILRLEFNLQIHTMSDLNIDIHMSALKKFLKTWPRWDDFDKLMRENNNMDIKEQIIQEEYAKLKEYLQRIIELTQAQAGPILEKVDRKPKKIASKTKIILPPPVAEKGELVMEVACSRDQLNRLFYRKPHPDTLTIFNITEEPAPSRISLNEITFKEVLNWPYINTTVSLPNFEFSRHNSSIFERTLINRKLPQNFTVDSLPTELYINTAGGYVRKKLFRKNVLVSFMVQLIKNINTLKIPSPERLSHLQCLFNEIKSDLLLMVNQMTIGCEYQYFMNKYHYARYLSTDQFASEKNTSTTAKGLKECINPNDFDLYLEEKISPAMKFEMLRFSVPYKEDISGPVFEIDCSSIQEATSNWLRFECTLCEVKFKGFLAIYHIVSHLNSHHANEPDWQCLKCNKVFTMNSLSANRWFHHC